MTLNFNRNAEAGADAALDWLVQLVERGAANDGSDDVAHTYTLRTALARIVAASLASGATQHYVATVAAGDITIEWDLLNLDNLAPALRARILPELASGSAGRAVFVNAGETAYELRAIPQPSSGAPTRVASTGAPGTQAAYSRGDHRHGGVVNFLDLGDTPDSFTGQGSRQLEVNSGGSAIIFAARTGGSTRTLNAGIADWDPLTNNAQVLVSEASAAETWTDWEDVYSHTVTTAGIQVAQANINGLVEAQNGASAPWNAIVPTSGGDRAAAQVRIINQTTQAGIVKEYIRNGGYLADDNRVADTLVIMVDAALNDVLKVQVRYQTQLIGAQGAGPTQRTASRLNIAANGSQFFVLNLGAVPPHSTPAPTHQFYMLFQTTAAQPTATEWENATAESTTGSLTVSGRPAPNQPGGDALVYQGIWSADNITHLESSLTRPDPHENLLSFFPNSGRQVVDGVNGYAWWGYQIHTGAGNGVWLWR